MDFDFDYIVVVDFDFDYIVVVDKDVLQNNDISAIADNIMNNVGDLNNNTNTNSNNNFNQTNPVNIKVGGEEDKNMIATVIPANQSFQPGSLSNNNNALLMNNINPNPINKDSFWLNAPSVPMDVQKNIITTENKLNREAMIMTVNNNSNNNNIFSNIEMNTQSNQANNMNDFDDDELNSRIYNLSPMNPIDTKYINNNHSLKDPNAIIPQYNNINNNNDYYDEMKQNMLGIKNEFSMIKQNQSSIIDDESINSYGMSKNIINNNNNYNHMNNKNSYYNTTNNTSKNNRSNSKKGINNNNVNINNKKGTIKNNGNNKVPKNSKKFGLL